MKVELLEPYIQISIEKESRFLKRAVDFAYKHFSKAYRLSSSVLILDDGERYKKDYFLNWAYHVAMQEENKKHSPNFQTIIDSSHLPIRIKMVENKAVLEHIIVSLQILHTSSLNTQVCLRLNRPNRLAKRYLQSLFQNFLISYTKQEIFLDSSSPYFWEKLVSMLSQKIIYNIVLDFDYETFKTNNTFECFGEYTTKEERLLKKAIRFSVAMMMMTLKMSKIAISNLLKFTTPIMSMDKIKKSLKAMLKNFALLKKPMKISNPTLNVT